MNILSFLFFEKKLYYDDVINAMMNVSALIIMWRKGKRIRILKYMQWVWIYLDKKSESKYMMINSLVKKIHDG